MQASTTRLRRLDPDTDQSEDEAPEVHGSAQPSPGEAQRRIISTALQLALRTLSQKTLVALASLYSLLLAGAVFGVFWRILADPTVLQLVGAGMFSIFVLAIHLVRKR